MKTRIATEGAKPDSVHPCHCKGYNGGQCYNCLNGAHEICDSKPKCRVRNAKRPGLMLVCKCESAPADSVQRPCSAVRELDAAMAGMNQEQRARMLDRAIMVMGHNHQHAQSMQVRTTIELILTQMIIEARNLRSPNDKLRHGGEKE